jgi:hypothetical protein
MHFFSPQIMYYLKLWWLGKWFLSCNIYFTECEPIWINLSELIDCHNS